MIDLSCKLPAEGSNPAELVVGSLDVMVGTHLPEEHLIGRLPEGPDGQHRAYLANVSTVPAARRRGVASQLIQAAESQAVAQGVKYMYAHVVADNYPALALYMNAAGYTAEQEELPGIAKTCGRPQRILVKKDLSA
ncbi:unnamed protein product [Ostreobium quekettii]|uniref:N-acetyltransferase domain-containing protein n=1 Tax=Ostreobium quekettii TaxID=121088 RepID=A0A8S1IYN3_9CHLO|nr:unnamed protein product [Ostreobium quekettii]